LPLYLQFEKAFLRFHANKQLMQKTGYISAAVLVLLLLGMDVKAQDYKTALGVRLSSSDAIVNNSVTFKYFFSNSVAVEGLLSFGDPVALGLLIEKHKPTALGGLTWFYGAGAYIGFESSKTENAKNFGAQGVLGLDYKLPALPLNLSVDWKPELNIVKEAVFEPAALGASIRFTFN
jgi:hypothetical protein